MQLGWYGPILRQEGRLGSNNGTTECRWLWFVQKVRLSWYKFLESLGWKTGPYDLV